MNIVLEKLPKCSANLSVEIPADTVARKRAALLRTYISHARIPGFRPGKAPASVVEKRHAKDIEGELADKLVDLGLSEALKKEDLKVLDFGTVRDITFSDDGCSFKTVLTLAPEITLPEYKGIAVTAPPAALPEAELTAQLESLRERFADFKPIEDRAAQDGDYAVIDYTSTVNGQPTEEFLGKPAGYLASKEDFWVRLGEGYFLPGFASQVVGMKPGESKDITITLPADYPVAELSEKQLVFATTLKELKQSILPELNDEFANRLSPGKTMEELTTIIRDNLTYERERKISDDKVNQIVAHLNSLVDCDLPESLVTEETQSQADSMVDRGIRAGMTEDEIKEQQNEIFAAAGHQAVSNVRTNFILREIAAAEKLSVSDQELAGQLVQIAASRKIEPKKFIRDMQKARRIEGVRQSMLVGKTLDFLLEHASVTEAPEAKINA